MPANLADTCCKPEAGGPGLIWILHHGEPWPWQAVNAPSEIASIVQFATTFMTERQSNRLRVMGCLDALSCGEMIKDPTETMPFKDPRPWKTCHKWHSETNNSC